MQAAAAEDSLIGQSLDNKYRIVRVIGQGGMGVVYEAEHTALGKRVAIKLMLEKYAGDSEAVARFTREALAASRIGNPHIIEVMDIGSAPDGRSYVVMELLSGQPLSKVIEDSGQMAPARAIAIMRQVLKAVGAAHNKGIVHRDLKPDNIFLLDHGESADFVKLLDFGISKMIDPDLQVAATKLTTTGVVMGTPLYMAPEQAMGAEIDHLADLYACGVMLYEMLAGKPPFDGATYAVLVAKLLTSEPPFLGELRPGLSPKLVQAVHRALEKDPKARFESADAFSVALPQPGSVSALELATTQAGNKRAVRGPAKPRRWPILAASVAMLAGIATASAIIIAQNKPNEPAPQPAPAKPETSEAPAPPLPSVTPIETAKPETPPPTPVAEVNSGLITVHSNPPGAVITIDGETLADGATKAVSVGVHKIHAELIGFEDVDATEDVLKGTKSSVTLTMIPARNVAAKTSKPGQISKATTGAAKSAKTSTSKPLSPSEMEALTKAALPTEEDPPQTAKTPAKPPVKLPPPPPPIKQADPPKTPATGPDTKAKPNPY